ncbi:MAG: hypothetical protein L3K04_07710, partial [Thermoplasmata archaeon]|nr:hypothetical protein [Thermoplasmata archaeon]
MLLTLVLPAGVMGLGGSTRTGTVAVAGRLASSVTAGTTELQAAANSLQQGGGPASGASWSCSPSGGAGLSCSPPTTSLPSPAGTPHPSTNTLPDWTHQAL